MNSFVFVLVLALLAVVVMSAGIALSAWQARRRALDRWLIPYLRQSGKRRPARAGEPVHLLLCVADHFEPLQGNTAPAVARARVDAWAREYPRLFGGFRDS